MGDDRQTDRERRRDGYWTVIERTNKEKRRLLDGY